MCAYIHHPKGTVVLRTHDINDWRNEWKNKLYLEIPSEINNLQLPDPELLMYYKNLEKRHLWIDISIDDGILGFTRQIMQWNEDDKGIPVEDRKPIHIYLQNGGGEISYMWLLIDIMEMSKNTNLYRCNECMR